MRKLYCVVFVVLISSAWAFAHTALEDNFNNGKGGWDRRGSTSNGGGVDWSMGYPVINLNTNNAQPHSIYHNIDTVALADGDTLRLTVDIKKLHTDASSSSIKIALGYADSVIGDSQLNAVPLDGYLIRLPSGGDTSDPVVTWVDAAGGEVNFFNSATENIGNMALDNTVSVGTNFVTAVFEINRIGNDLVFYGSLDGTAFGNTVSVTSAVNTVTNFMFNTVGLTFAYENSADQAAAYDNVRVEVNPDPEVIELFATTFDYAVQSGSWDTPITMDGNRYGVSVSPLTAGIGANSNLTFLLKPDDTAASAGMYATNYASVTAINLGDGNNTDMATATNLAMAIATDSYLEFTVDSSAIDYETLNFKMIKFGFGPLAGVTVRSSLDGYTEDLASFEDNIDQGAFAVAVKLSDVAGFSAATNVTFRFYLYNQWADSQTNRKMGLDDIRLTGKPAGAHLFDTSFDGDFLQPAGSDTPILIGTGDRHAASVAVGNLVPGSGASTGFNIQDYDTVGSVSYAGTVVISLGDGSAPQEATNIASAVANDAYFEFTVTGAASYETLNFNLVQIGFTQLGGVTVRSSLDGYTADLVTVTGNASGIYPAFVDLSSVSGFDNASEVTFRFYLYGQYTGTQSNRRIGIDDIYLTGIPTASTLLSTDFETAVQSAVGDPVDMAAALHPDVTASVLTNGVGVTALRLDSVTSSDTGLLVMEGMTDPPVDLAAAVASDEYFEFTVSSSQAVDLELLSFDYIKHGFSQFAGVTLRSSVDGYTADLLTIANELTAGAYPTFVDLSSNTAFDGITNVTFRLYLYANTATHAGKRLGMDNLNITGVFAGEATAAILTITTGSGNMIISADNLSPSAQHQLQSRASLTSGSWGDVGAAVTGVAATNWVISTSSPAEFYQVQSSN